MKWTKETPTVPGAYWTWDKDRRSPPMLVEVADGNTLGFGSEETLEISAYDGDDWAGPLSPPEE